MKNLWILISCCTLLFLSCPTTPEIETTIYEMDFSGNTGWGTISGTGYSTGYDNDRYYYYLEIPEAKQSVYHNLAVSAPYSFSVDATLELENTDPANGGYNTLLFNRKADDSEYYYLAIGRDSAFQIYYYKNGNTIDYYPAWVINSAIKPLGQTNNIKIKQYSNRVVIIINDVTVAEEAIHVSTPVYVGIGSGCNATGYGYTPVTSYFDNFRIASITTN